MARAAREPGARRPRAGARDRQGDPTDVLERLDRLEAAHPRVLARTLGISFTSDLVALDAVCVAERARAANRVDLARMAEARERSA